jgi:hypothetical protein
MQSPRASRNNKAARKQTMPWVSFNRKRQSSMLRKYAKISLLRNNHCCSLSLSRSSSRLEASPSLLDAWSRVGQGCRTGARARNALLVHMRVIQIVHAITSHRSCVGLVFLVELLLRAGHTSRCDFAEETAQTAVCLVDSFVLAFSRTW